MNETTEPLEEWKPVTSLGKKVKAKEITNIDEILDNGMKILEAEIVDQLLPDLQVDLLFLGQSKGKFGGGQRRAFRQTQKKTREGNKPKFSTVAVVGNEDGYVGIGFGKSKETVPAREKAIRNAKINLIKIRRGSGSWESSTEEAHSLPFKVQGKCGSVVVELIPAPKGTGLQAEKEIAKILEKAGIKDAWSKSRGKTSTRYNLIKACYVALQQTMKTRVMAEHSVVEGKVEVNA